MPVLASRPALRFSLRCKSGAASLLSRCHKRQGRSTRSSRVFLFRLPLSVGQLEWRLKPPWPEPLCPVFCGSASGVWLRAGKSMSAIARKVFVVAVWKTCFALLTVQSILTTVVASSLHVVKNGSGFIFWNPASQALLACREFGNGTVGFIMSKFSVPACIFDVSNRKLSEPLPDRSALRSSEQITTQTAWSRLTHSRGHAGGELATNAAFCCGRE